MNNPIPKDCPLHIVEGVAGIWHYHLSITGLNGKPSLCGISAVMKTSMPLSVWNEKSHLNETYCKECSKIAETTNFITSITSHKE